MGPGHPPDLPRAHSIHHKTAWHREMVRVSHSVLTAALCISAVMPSIHREVKRLTQRHTAVRAEHAFLCVQVYPCVSLCFCVCGVYPCSRSQSALPCLTLAPRSSRDGRRPTYEQVQAVAWAVGPGPLKAAGASATASGQTWVPATPPSSPLCLPPLAASGWRVRTWGSLPSPARTPLGRPDGIGCDLRGRPGLLGGHDFPGVRAGSPQQHGLERVLPP